MNFTALKTTWTDSMKNYAITTLQSALTKVDLDVENTDIKVTKLNKEFKVDLINGGFIVQSVDEDFYVALSKAASNLKKLAIKKSKRELAKKERSFSIKPLLDGSLFEDNLNTITAKEKVFILSPSTIEKAIDNFEQTDFTFYAYRDIELNNEVSILYRRKNGTIGVIRCR